MGGCQGVTMQTLMCSDWLRCCEWFLACYYLGCYFAGAKVFRVFFSVAMQLLGSCGWLPRC